MFSGLLEPLLGLVAMKANGKIGLGPSVSNNINKNNDI